MADPFAPIRETDERLVPVAVPPPDPAVYIEMYESFGLPTQLCKCVEIYLRAVHKIHEYRVALLTGSNSVRRQRCHHVLDGFVALRDGLVRQLSMREFARDEFQFIKLNLGVARH
jgi:hypothetical protein